MNMKTKSIISIVSFLLLVFIASCDNFERKGDVTPEITVNMQSLQLFVGDSEQLKANPTNLGFAWQSEDPEIAIVNANGMVTAVSEGSTNIVVRSGDIILKVPVTTVDRIPLTDFQLSTTEISMSPGKTSMAVPIRVPANANDVSLPVWVSKDPNIATVDYKGEIRGRAVGVVEIECTINNITRSVTVEIWLTKPFVVQHVITKDEPYTLRAIDFDYGGQNNAYWDSSTGNAGNNNYRANNGDPGCTVDIGGDLAVGWTAAGEWQIYSIDVKDAGVYHLSLDAAVDANSRYRVELLEGEHESGVWANWRNITGAVSIRSTGGWSSWAWLDLPDPVTLPAGKQKIRFYFEQAAFNFRSLKFTHEDLLIDYPALVSGMLSGESSKNWKIGPWTAMREPGNRNNIWWDFKDPPLMNDIFTFISDGSFVYENNGDTFMNEELGALFPDGDPDGSFVTTHYDPPADATWNVTMIDGQLILTINKGFLGYAAGPDDLVKAQYLITDYSETSLKLIYYSGWDGWCYEIVPAN